MRTSRQPRSALRAPVALACLLLAMLAALSLLPPASPARADDGAQDAPPVRLVLTTAGLTWEDIDSTRTPTLACLADRSGLAAMNTTSTSVVSTKRQGLETLHTGYRGLAERAPASAGIPTPPTDQWQQLPVRTVRIEDSTPGEEAGAEAAAAIESGAIVQVDLPSVPDHEDPARSQQLTALDARLAAVLEPFGGCEAALPRTLLVSVAATDPPDPDDMERTGAVASRTVGLQVYMDTAFPAEAITSGSTKQDGIIALTDVLPTVLDSHDAAPEGRIQGQAVQAVPHSDPLQLAVDRSRAARLVDMASIPALLSWMLIGLAGSIILLIPALARWPRLTRIARAAAAVGPLALPAGLVAQVLPWWRSTHPTWALIGTVWLLASVLSVVALCGPWRRHRFGPVGVAAALTAGVMLLESATGSHLQIGSPLGAQPISGGRYYGLSNHLFGVVLAATLMALLCLFARVSSPRARTLWTLGIGGVVAVVCVAPSMGADFGSMLVTVPVFGLLALLVSGIRVRLWHLLALGAAGAAAVLGVSFLDWLRPPEQRTHLGRFIDELLSGELLAVVIRKLAQNLAMTTGYLGLMVLLAFAVAASVIILVPRLVRWGRLERLRTEGAPGDPASAADPSAAMAPARAVLLVLVLGTWAGYAVNDTGPVLVAGVVAVWLLQLPALLPAPAMRDGHRPVGDGRPDPVTRGA